MDRDLVRAAAANLFGVDCCDRKRFHFWQKSVVGIEDSEFERRNTGDCVYAEGKRDSQTRS